MNYLFFFRQFLFPFCYSFLILFLTTIQIVLADNLKPKKASMKMEAFLIGYLNINRFAL